MLRFIKIDFNQIQGNSTLTWVPEDSSLVVSEEEFSSLVDSLETFELSSIELLSLVDSLLTIELSLVETILLLELAVVFPLHETINTNPISNNIFILLRNPIL